MKTGISSGVFLFLTMIMMGQAKISLESTTIDYSDVVKGKSVSKTITFRNSGDKPLHIDKIETTSRHLSISKPNNDIAPGKNGKITVGYDTKVEGPIRRTITIYSNASNSPVMPIKVKGCVISAD